jgi:hypothetical protein
VSAPATKADGPGAVTRQAGRLRARLPRLVFHEPAIVAACYLLAAIGATALLWRDPASRIVAGNPGDPDQMAWWLRYAAEAVAHWHLPAIVTSGMNTPAGVNAMWNPSILVPGVALSFVTLTLGPQVSLNVMLTIGFAGSAFSLYWVLRRWGVGTMAAVAGGLAYGFSPALTQASLGHYDLQFGVFPPLIVHFTARLVTGRGKDGAPVDPVKAGAALGLVTALQLLTAEELLFNTVLAVVIGLLVAAVGRSRYVANVDAALRVASGALTAMGVLVLIAGYPLWIQFHGPLTQHGSPYLLDFYKNDLLGFVQPSRLQLIHSQASAAFADKFQGNLSEYAGYLGWPMLCVLAFAAFSLWRLLAVRVLAVTFLVLEVFSLGGTLLLNGHVHSWFKLPWNWLQNYPLFSSAVVDRFSIIADGFAAALLAILIDAGWQASADFLQSARGRLRARLAIGLATAVVVVPLLPAPLPTSTLAGVPPGWAQVMTALRLPEGASVLAVPVPTATFTNPLRWEADTGMPASMVGGYFIGPSWNGEAYSGGPGLDQVPQYLNQLWAAVPPPTVNPAGVQTTTQLQSDATTATWIHGSGVSAVVAVTSLQSPLATYLTKVLGPPAVQSGDVLGWHVDRGP